MDQRSQAMSVAGRAALFERIIDILARQHRERVSGDTQRLNEQQTVIGILRMLDYEEPAEGATSKAAPPRPAAQQPPQPQGPNGHGLVDFHTTTDKYTCDACKERLSEASVFLGDAVTTRTSWRAQRPVAQSQSGCAAAAAARAAATTARAAAAGRTIVTTARAPRRGHGIG